MTINEYLSFEHSPVVDGEVKKRAVAENLRTSFFSSGYRPAQGNFFGNEMDNFYRKTYLSLHQMESDAAKKWKESNYVPVATSYYIDGLNKVSGTIFTADNFTPSFFGSKEYEDISEQLGGWYEWLQSWLLPNLIAFPNDFIFFDVTGKNEFSISKIPFCEVDYFDKDLIVFNYNGTKIFSDKERTIKVASNGDILTELNHFYGSAMFMQLGGVLLNDYFSSYFQGFIAHAEQFARINPQYYYELAKAFNMLVMARNECRACAGSGEVHNENYTLDCDGCSPVKVCGTCKGKAVKTVSPSDIYEVATQDFDKNVAQNVATWISPNIETIQIKQQEDRFLREEMKQSLYIERAGVNQSGESKKMDNYAFILFVRPIASRLHSLAQFVGERAYSLLKSAGSVGMKKISVSIVEPISLDYLSAEGLRAEMDVSKSDKDLFRSYQKQNYAKSFPSDLWLPFISEVRAFVDAYSNFSDADFLNLVKIGRVAENDYFAHVYFDKAVQRILYKGNKQDFINGGVISFSDLVLAEIEKARPVVEVLRDENGDII